MKIKEKPDTKDVIFPSGTADSIEPSEDNEEISHMTSTSPTSSVSTKTELSREAEIAELDLLLAEFPDTRFHRKKRKEIEAHRKELIKAQQSEEREKLRLAQQARKEEKRHAKWAKKSVDAETMTKIAEEHQKESLARDRKCRARRRKIDKIFSMAGKAIFVVSVIFGVLSLSNENIRSKIGDIFYNFYKFVRSWTDNPRETRNGIPDVNNDNVGFTIEDEIEYHF
ncbi:hypothetical protein AALB81_15060 [Lachnospiraceae bacterium 48-33]